MAVYHGRKGVVYMSTSGSGSAASVTSMANWSLSRATDYAETTAFGDSNKTWVQGLPDVSGTISGFFNDASSTLYTGSTSTDGVKLYLYPSSDVTTKYFYGPAWVDYSITTDNKDAVKISASFKANGSWGAQ